MVKGIKGDWSALAALKAKKKKEKAASNNVAAAAKKSDAEKKKEKKRLQELYFNKQMYLLDWMASNTSEYTAHVAKRSSRSYDVDDSVNKTIANKTRGDFNGLYDFLTMLSPHEYAQMTPQIKLYLVLQGMCIPIPLTAPTNINKTLTNTSDYYYSGNAIGLKSFDMEIDGSANPVTGRIYNTTLNLVFDSINTFLNPVPGLSTITYADLFRGLGSSSQAKWAHSLKLEIGYSTANEELRNKYALGQDVQTFIANLSFIKSDLNIEENLKTSVKVKFQAIEESLVGDDEKFNFLILDLEDQKKQEQARIALMQKIGAKEKKSIEEEMKPIKTQIKTLQDKPFRYGTFVFRPLNEKQRREVFVSERTMKAAGKPYADKLKNVREVQPTDLLKTMLAYSPDSSGGYDPATHLAPLQDYFAAGGKIGGKGFKEAYSKARGKLPRSAAGGLMGLRGSGPGRNAQDEDIVLSAVASESALMQAFGDRLGLIEDQIRLLAPIERRLAAMDAAVKRQIADYRAETVISRKKQINNLLKKLIWSQKELIGETKLDPDDMHDYKESIISDRIKDYFDSSAVPTSKKPKQKPTDNKTYAALMQKHEAAAKKAAKKKAGNLAHEKNKAIILAADINNLKDLQKRVNEKKLWKKERLDTQLAGSCADRWQMAGLRDVLETNGVLAGRQVHNEPKGMERPQYRMDTGLCSQTDVSHDIRLGATATSKAGLEKQGRYIEKALKVRSEELKEANSKITKLTEDIGGELSQTKIEHDLMFYKSIQYILFGDLLRILIKHIKENGSGKDDIKVRHTIFMLNNVTLKSVLQAGRDETFSLYDIPIDIDALQKMFGDKLTGNNKNTFTIKELIREVLHILVLAQQRKFLLLKNTSTKNNFKPLFYTYPLQKDGNSYIIDREPKNIINSAHDTSYVGVVIHAQDDRSQDLALLGGNFSANKKSNIPHMFIGGPAGGAQKKIQVTEIADEGLKKAVYEMNKTAIEGATDKGNIPVFFTIELTLMGAPYFQLGSYFYIESPSLNTKQAKSWFHLDGYYAVTKLSHSYKAGGHFTTIVTGHLALSTQTIRNLTISAGKKLGAVLANRVLALVHGVKDTSDKNLPAAIKQAKAMRLQTKIKTTEEKTARLASENERKLQEMKAKTKALKKQNKEMKKKQSAAAKKAAAQEAAAEKAMESDGWTNAD